MWLVVAVIYVTTPNIYSGHYNVFTIIVQLAKMHNYLKISWLAQNLTYVFMCVNTARIHLHNLDWLKYCCSQSSHTLYKVPISPGIKNVPEYRKCLVFQNTLQLWKWCTWFIHGILFFLGLISWSRDFKWAGNIHNKIRQYLVM